MVKQIVTIQAAANRQEACKVINAVRSDWIARGLIERPEDVAKGMCEDFANEVADRLAKQGLKATVRWSDEWWSDDFVMDITRLQLENAPLPNAADKDLSLLLGAMTHAWVEVDGMIYNAEAPKGVKHFMELPFFQTIQQKANQ
jgi:hypothetical protein